MDEHDPFIDDFPIKHGDVQWLCYVKLPSTSWTKDIMDLHNLGRIGVAVPTYLLISGYVNDHHLSKFIQIYLDTLTAIEFFKVWKSRPVPRPMNLYGGFLSHGYPYTHHPFGRIGIFHEVNSSFWGTPMAMDTPPWKKSRPNSPL